jgi:alpha-tubulin suppressor-like RCC1 family protein
LIPSFAVIGGPPLRRVRFAHSLWHALGLLGGLVAIGCSDELQVLAPADAGADAASTDAAEPLVDAGPAPDAGPNACGGCGALQLCSTTGCVDVSGIRSISANLEHTCLVKGGRLFCFGKNAGGQLGLDDRLQRELPSRVGVTSDWLQVGVGEGHSCGLRAPGALYCWGDNTLGQLGLGDTVPRLEPTRVGALDDWERLACGGANCCALRAGGALYCWGDNLEGKPAQGDGFSEPDVLEPRPAATEQRFAELAIGQGHVCAISLDGELFGWGRNIAGETGTAPGVAQLRVPTRVGSERDWVSVAAAQHHSCGVRGDGSLWCWGKNTHQQLGLPPVPDGGEDVLMPALVGSERDWAAVAAGWFHTCALARDGGLYCMGRSEEGQLAQPAGAPIGTLTPVFGLEATPPPEGAFGPLALGSFHSCALQQDGTTAYCWGENNAGQLGVGDLARRYTPTAVAVP